MGPRARKPVAARGAAVKLDTYLRRARLRRWLIGPVAVLGLVLVIVADQSGWLLHRGGDWERYEGRRFVVVHVVDGDTLDIAAPDGERTVTRVRLWGVDTPETAKPQLGKTAQPFADDAADFTRQLCEGQSVRLRLQRHRLRGKFGRVLAYVELPDGTMLNERLLIVGLARWDSRFDHALHRRFELIEQQSRIEKRGMWAQ